MRLAIQFAYDGRAFHGYARQPHLKTVEGDIISLLIKHRFIENAAQSKLRSASRTDKGVSALCNVVAFNTEASLKNVLRQLSKESADIIFYGLAKVSDTFYPRHARLRSYRYYLKKQAMDSNILLTAASLFTGEHNFSNFARVEEFKNPVRIIDTIVVTENDEFFVIDFYAQTFLWHQIRRIISAIGKVGRGKLEKERIIDALNNPDKKVDFGLVPAEPLILKDIMYDFEFEYDTAQMGKPNSIERKIATSLLE